MKTTLKTFLLAVLIAGPVYASTYKVPFDYPNIRAAIDAAADFDTIVLSPGTYTGPNNLNIDFRGKKVVVQSMDPKNPQTVGDTVIDCKRMGRAFVFQMAETSDSKVIGLTITNGYAFLGGAIYCYNNSSPSIIGCVLVGNSATFGGAIACANTASLLEIANCRIVANSATVGGGAVYCNGASPTLRNCIVSGNCAPQGGGIYTHYTGSPVVTGCTIAANTASQQAAGIYCFGSSNVGIANTVLWGDKCTYAPEILVGNTGSPTSVTVSYCDIAGGQAGIIRETGCTVNWGLGNMNTDPCFVDNGSPVVGQPFADGDYHVLGTSPCIDAGDPAFAPRPAETDIDGTARVSGSRVDIGADEYPAAAIVARVDLNPKTINLGANMKTIHCAVTLPEGYDIRTVNLSTVRLDSQIVPVWSVIDETEQKLQLKFDRQHIEEKLQSGQDSVVFQLSGWLNDGTNFAGTDTVGVFVSPGKNKN